MAYFYTTFPTEISFCGQNLESEKDRFIVNWCSVLKNKQTDQTKKSNKKLRRPIMAIHAKVGIWKHNVKLSQTRATYLWWSCSSLKASHVLTQKLRKVLHHQRIVALPSKLCHLLLFIYELCLWGQPTLYGSGIFAKRCSNPLPSTV